MPRAKPQDSRRVATPSRYRELDHRGSNDKKFVNFELSLTEKQRLKEVRGTTAFAAETILAVFAALGYSISLKYDRNNECDCCFVIPADEKDANFGAILSGRGRSYLSALQEVYTKHLAMDGTWQFERAGSKQGTWDDE